MSGEGIDLSFRFDPVDRETWRERVEADLGEVGFDSLAHTLDGGLVIRPLYTEEDRPAHESGWPGAPPFARGARTEASWRVVHEARGVDATAIVDVARRARGGGADAILLGPDAFDRIDVEALHAIGGPVVADPGADALAWLRALDGIEGAELRFDPLGVLARGGALPYGIEMAWRVLAELAADGRRVFIDTRPYHEGGAAPADEIAIALATGVEYLRALSDRDHPLADAPRRMVFAFACDADVFVGIAKLRAARLTWSKVLRALGIDGPDEGMRIHAFASRRTRSQLEPVIDVLRGTAAAFAAIVGGAQDVTLDPYEDTPRGERLARNTQLLLRWETHLERVIDPAGGSYFIEALTDALARRAWDTFQACERAGGMLAGLASGSIQERVAASAATRIEGIARRRVGRVGVNRYAGPDDPPAVVAPREVSRRVGDERPGKSVRDAFESAPRGALSAAILASDASVAALRTELFRGDGEVVVSRIDSVRDAAGYETLRRRAAALPEAQRDALVIGLGPEHEVLAKMEFSSEALGIAGLRPRGGPVGSSYAELEIAVVPATVVVCAATPALAREALAPLREAGARQLLSAGRPSERDPLDVEAHLHRGMDALRVLGGVIERLEGRS